MRIAVVGAGVIGCATSYELAARGAAVTVFERRAVGRGASWASAGVLAPWIEAYRHPRLLDMCAQSLSLYDDFVARVRRDSGALFDYARNGTLDVALSAHAAETLRSAADTLSSRGVPAEWLEAPAAHALEPALDPAIEGALRIDAHGYVQMPAFVDALAAAARMRGASLRFPVDITRIESAPGDAVRLHADGVPHLFDRIVIAGGSWSGRFKLGGPVVAPVKGQLLRLRFATPPASRVLWSKECYMVPWKDGTLLVGATMEHAGFDERPTSAAVALLTTAAAALLPATRDAEFVDVRAGLRPSIAGDDSLPFVGPSPALPQVTIATGHFRNGVLLAPLTARMVADQLLGGQDGEAL